jgi:uncharacterized membrane protein YhaH (DUF805 family)
MSGPTSMQALRFVFSPAGRLRPQAFIIAVIAVDAAGAASQWFALVGATARSGLWLFAVAQAVLTWVWFALHARRLRDAGRSIGLAAGAAVLYALSVVLLLTVATSFFAISPSSTTDANTVGALTLILLLSVMESLSAASSYDLGRAIVAILVVLALLPVVVAMAVTLWAATRASVGERPA